MKQIFIVDDEVTNLRIAENALKDKYKLKLLTGGKQLFVMLERELPELILLDIQMPEIDGIAVMEILKEHEDYNKIPVIFLTSNTDKDIVVKALKLGAIDYIAKPFDANTLFQRIQKCIGF
ncbi:MAG: response regulator [Spirochaetaceae bacterium]|nr:response regulator [Spirochaetaceae bacterium]MBP5329004.1 response regulator [Spirochaetaceae bacterium]